jgi:hypothetical protein
MGSNLEGKIGAPYMAKTLQNFNVKSLDAFARSGQAKRS